MPEQPDNPSRRQGFARRLVGFLMAVYLVAIAYLVFAYGDVSKCLAEYAAIDNSATAARSEAGAKDRQLNKRESDLNASDRSRFAADQRAFGDAFAAALTSVGDQAKARELTEGLVAQLQETERVLRDNEAARERLNRERGAVEAFRAANPVPPKPSC